ncbi:hypothetical protein GGX14DRAFT_587932 [Mycena pura]|uniref:Uncharacterized protein n=1 Tax=Mycena pura TaxID=153505 RepID=A0AAD6Y0U8_9AGAR|nr:hypothetical protein GGX14DRAFT_587932 [Mycena pura]
MAQRSAVARSSTLVSDSVKLQPPKPMKLTGIIILPPSYRRSDDESPTSSTSDAQLQLADPSSSVADFSGTEHELARGLDRRLSMSTGSLNVRFAPLPQIAPRKRRSTTPLGIASRSAMMRRRRAGTPGYDMNGDPLPPPPAWTPEEIERHAREREREREEDPLLTLGKMVKGVWRRVNNKKPAPGDEEKAGARGAVIVAERIVLAPLPADNAASGEEQGGVWEEEVSDRFPLNVSQTETIVEGRYPWLAAQLVSQHEETSSTSDDGSGKERAQSSSDDTEENSS